MPLIGPHQFSFLFLATVRGLVNYNNNNNENKREEKSENGEHRSGIVKEKKG